MDFPGSIRGLEFDNRYEPWFKKALFPPKDVVIVVDHSGSMEAAAPCGSLKLAEAQVSKCFSLSLSVPNPFSFSLVALQGIFLLYLYSLSLSLCDVCLSVLLAGEINPFLLCHGSRSRAADSNG